jgi:FAD/FMN-containing dehydrogenase
MPYELLKNIVGDGAWIDSPAELQPYVTEWRDRYTGSTPLMLLPSSTAQVAAIVGTCNEHGAAVVPQGGNTGLCGGAVPDTSNTQILLSFSRMKEIRAIEPENFSMTVDAGCVLADIQAAAGEVDRLFPLSLAAEGSCQIGGNLSTNAGGLNVLKYGTARDQVLGLEVVLADGSVWDGLRTLRKNTAGYDLKQLFIGSEGTLGIITAASLRLYPVPRNLQTAMLAISAPDAAIRILSALRSKLSDQLQTFELIPDRALRYVRRHIAGTRKPFEQASPWYVLLQSSTESGEDRFQAALLGLLEEGAAQDVIVAKNETEAAGLWNMRHHISEAQKLEGASLKHDVSVPVNRIGTFIDAAEAAVLRHLPGARIVAFGHVGDGNVHFNVSQPREWLPQDFYAERDTIEGIVFGEVDRQRGSISAEHGIGRFKRRQLPDHIGQVELRTMQTLKSALDPKGTLNPGKVI